MGRGRRERSYPTLSSGNEVAVTKYKAEMMVNAFVAAHSYDHLSEDGGEGRKKKEH